MGLNYSSRFLYCEKVFLKFDRNLFCLNTLNVETFDLEFNKYKVLCNDYQNYISRYDKVFYYLGQDIKKYSSLIGDKLLYNNISRSVRPFFNVKYFTNIEASQEFLNRTLSKLLKEREKRKSAHAEEQTNNSIFTLLNPTDLPKSGSFPSATGQASAGGSPSLSPLPLPSATSQASTERVINANPNADNIMQPPSNHVSVPESVSVEGRKAQDPHFFSAIAPPLLSNPSDQSMPLNLHLPSFSGLQNFFNSFLDVHVPNIRFLSRVLPIFLILLSTMGMRFSSFNEYLLKDYKEIVTLWPNSLITLSLVAALAITYALNSRKMPKPKVMVQLLFQVLITFLLIYVIFHLFTNTTSSEIPELINKINPPADPTDNEKINPQADNEKILAQADNEKINPPANPTDNEKINPTDPAYKSDGALPVNPTDPASELDGPAWYSNKKVWGCILIAGLAAVVYYLKGFAPASSDDMETFRNIVSEGVDNIASSQVSLSQTMSERVESAAFKADILNSTSEEMLSDIVAAGNAARLQLEQMGVVGEDFNQLHSRVDTINDKMTVLLKGIVYLISLRWVFFRSSNETPASGSSVVNEVLSKPRPFSFDSTAQTDEATVAAAVVQTATYEIPTQTDEAAVAAAVAQTEALATYEISTQTDDMFMDRAYTVLRPAIDSVGEPHLLVRLRQLVCIISDTLTSSNDDDDDDDEFEEAVTNISVTSRETNISIASKDTVYSIAIDTELRQPTCGHFIPSIIEGSTPERSPGSTPELSSVTPERSPATELPSTSTNPNEMRAVTLLVKIMKFFVKPSPGDSATLHRRGLEPLTTWFEARDSIRLSYRCGGGGD